MAYVTGQRSPGDMVVVCSLHIMVFTVLVEPVRVNRFWNCVVDETPCGASGNASMSGVSVPFGLFAMRYALFVHVIGMASVQCVRLQVTPLSLCAEILEFLQCVQTIHVGQ